MLLTEAVVLAASVLVDPAGRLGAVVARPRLGRGRRRSVGWLAIAVLGARRGGGPESRRSVRDAVAGGRARRPHGVAVRTAPWPADAPCALVLRADRTRATTLPDVAAGSVGRRARGSGSAVPAQRNSRFAGGVRGPSPIDTGSSLTSTIRDLIAMRAKRTQLPW